MKTFFFDKSLLVFRYCFYSEIKEFLKSSFDGNFYRVGIFMKLVHFILGALTTLYLGVAAAAVNINTATAKELEALPGIGAKKAQAIVEYREEHGGSFKSVDELKEVKGIGPKLLEKMRPEITVSNKDTHSITAKPAKKVEKSDNASSKVK